MTRPISHRSQSGCHNCAHAFVLSEYDEGLSYFCALDAPPRPKSGSVAMDEMFDTLQSDEDYMREMDTWKAWADPRAVSAWDTCDQWAASAESPAREGKAE